MLTANKGLEYRYMKISFLSRLSLFTPNREIETDVSHMHTYARKGRAWVSLIMCDA